MNSLKKYVNLYFSFFKIGLFTIGGGYVMLPMLIKEVVDNKHWAIEEEVIDSYALAQSIPGVIIINTAVLFGYKKAKLKGAITCALGISSPSVIIIIAIADIYHKISDNIYLINAFKGIRVAVVALLILTIVKMIKKSIKDIFGVILMISSCVLLLFFDISPIVVIVISSVVSIIYYQRGEINGRDS
jgi:chromate transporter